MRSTQFRRATFVGLAFAVVSILAGTASATMVYQVDDGTPEQSLTVTPFADVLWFNGFTVVPGGEVITGIEVGFDHEGIPPGYPFTAVLYQGADGSGNPNNGLIPLFAAPFVVAGGPGLVFQTVPVPGIVVSDKFFVGLFGTFGAPDAPVALDDTTSAGVSWAYLDNPGAVNPLVPPPGGYFLIDDAGFPGNFIIRAEAEPVNAVPEPLTLLALTAGVGSLGAYLRRRRPAD